jgi:O-antigen ligase
MSAVESFRETISKNARWLWLPVIIAGAPILGILAASSTLLGIVAGVALTGLSLALIWSENLTRQRLVITLLVSSILLPGIPIPGLWNVRLEEILALALIPAVVFRKPWYWTYFDLFFAFVGGSTLISMAWGSLLGVPLSLRDLMELVKVIKYWLFFHFALYPWNEKDMRKAVNYVLVSMGVAGLIGILQWQNWLGIGRPLSLLYGHSSTHAEEGRMVGTTANPNQFALLMATGLGIVMGALKDAARRRQILLIGMGALLVLVTIVTGSRTGGAGILIVLLVGILLRIGRNRSIRQRLRWLGIAVLIGMVVGFLMVPWVVQEVQRLKAMSPTEILDYVKQGPLSKLLYRFSVATSDQHGIGRRMEIWRSHWKLFKESPILGWGPGKARFERSIDSEYVLYLRRYGAMGMFSLLLLYWYVFLFCWNLLRRRCPLAWRMGAAIIAILMTYLAANFVTSTFYDLQLMSFFWLTVGLGYSIFRFPPMSPCESAQCMS